MTANHPKQPTGRRSSVAATGSLPEQVLAHAQAGREVIQQSVALADSLEWTLGQEYLRLRGNKAFLSDVSPVPFVVNNDGTLSRNAAEVFFASLEAAEKDGTLEDEIVVLELGIGVGLFARYFLDTMRELSRRHQKDYYDRLTYIAADRSERMLHDVLRHGVLSGHPGRYCVRVVDAMEPEAALVGQDCNLPAANGQVANLPHEAGVVGQVCNLPAANGQAGNLPHEAGVVGQVCNLPAANGQVANLPHEAGVVGQVCNLPAANGQVANLPHKGRLRAVFLNYLLDCLPAAVLHFDGDAVRQLCVRTCVARNVRLADYTDLTAEQLRQRASSLGAGVVARSPDRATIPPVVARSPDRATGPDRRSPEAAKEGDLRSRQVARSGDRATTRGVDEGNTASGAAGEKVPPGRRDLPGARDDLLEVYGLFASEYDYQPVEPAKLPYGDFAVEHARGWTKRLLHSYGAIACLEKLLCMLAPGGFVLVNDYGPTQTAREDEFEHQRFSLATFVGVNFAELKAYFGEARHGPLTPGPSPPEGRGVHTAGRPLTPGPSPPEGRGELRKRCQYVEPAGEEGRGIHARLLGNAVDEDVRVCFAERFGEAAHKRLQEPIEKARAWARAGRFEMAADCYNDAIHLQPGNWVLLCEVSHFLTFQFGDAKAAADMAKAALALNPTCSAELWNALGDALFKWGRVEEARSAYEKALAVNAADVRARYNLAWVHARLKDYPTALGRIAEALALDKTGAYRDALLQKQREVLGLLAERHQTEYLLLINLVSRRGKQDGEKEGEEPPLGVTGRLA